MQVNKLLIRPLDFANFFEQDWGKFYRKIILEAKDAADDAAESMGGGEVPGVPLLPGSHTEDQRYLSQFHPDVQEQALKRRYNSGLLDAGDYWDAHGDYPPEDWNHAKDGIRFKVPKKKGSKVAYRVYLSIDGKPIYLGDSELVKRLSAPAKSSANDHMVHPEKFKEGPGLGEMDPKDPDSVDKYLEGGHHGFYDFDLSGVVRQTDAIIDNMSDEEIVDWLKGTWKKKWDEAPKDKEGNKILPDDLKKEIKKARDAAKAEPNHTMSGYEVMKKNVANRILPNWIKATSLGLLGEVPDKVPDPVTGVEVPVIKMPHDQAEKYFSQIDYLQAGFNPLRTRLREDDPKDLGPEGTKQFKLNRYHHTPEKVENLDVYVIPRTVSWREEDEDGKVLGNKTETFYVPYLPDTKTVPQLDTDVQLTDGQKAILAHREAPNLVPKGTPEEMEKRYKEILEGQNKEMKAAAQRAANIKDVTRIIDNWDLWTDAQKKHFKDNGRTLPEVSRAYWAKDKSDDYYSNLSNNMATLGHSVNRLSIKQGYLGIPEDKMEEFKHKYLGLMSGEAKEAIDKWVAVHKKGKGLYPIPMGVVDTLDEVSEHIIVISSYFLLTWLNDPMLGIFDKDPKYGLTSEKRTTEAKARTLRSYKVFWMMETLSQAALMDWPSRRAREKLNALWDSVDRGISSGEGKSTTVGASQAGGSKEELEAKLKNMRYSHSSRRGVRTPGTDVARTGWKISVAGTEARVEEFMHTIRSRVRKILGDSAGKVVDNAEAKVAAAIAIANLLMQKYYEEAKKQFPNDDDKAEKMASDALIQNLDKELKNHPELFGGMNAEESDDFINKVRSQLSSKTSGMSTSEIEKNDKEYIQKLRKAMDEFFMELLDEEEGYQAVQPVYNPGTQEFEDDGMPINLMRLKIKQADSKNLGPSIKELVKVLKSLYPPDLPEEAQYGLNKYALDVYQELLDISHLGRKPTAEAIADLEAVDVRPEQAKHATGVVHAPTPQVVHAPPPAKAATTSTNELVGDISNFDTPEQLMQKIHAILSKRQEIKADPTMAAKVKAAPDMIHHRMMQVGMKSDMKIWTLMSELKKFADTL
jgi:hypothetical protein